MFRPRFGIAFGRLSDRAGRSLASSRSKMGAREMLEADFCRLGAAGGEFLSRDPAVRRPLALLEGFHRRCRDPCSKRDLVKGPLAH
jgi:hypothetical protein